MPDSGAPWAPPIEVDVSPCTTTSCRIADGRADHARDELCVGKRIGLPAAAELRRGERRHYVIGCAEKRVLAGQHEVRPDTPLEERFTRGASLMASGRVPATSATSWSFSLPPTSARHLWRRGS